MFKQKRIYSYLGDCDPLLNARATARCGQTVVPCGDASGVGGEPTPVATFGIGTPTIVPVTPGRTPTNLDCQTLDTARSVVVAVTSGSGAFIIEAALITTDSGTGVSIGAIQNINSTLTNWQYVSVVVLTPTTFIVFGQHGTGGTASLRGIVCTITGSTITPGAPVTLVAAGSLQANSVRVKALKLRDDSTDTKCLIAYWLNVANPGGRIAVVTMDGSNLTLGTPATVPTGATVFRDFFLCDAQYEDLYKVMHINSTGGQIVYTTVYVYMDDTVTVAGSGVNLVFNGLPPDMVLTPAAGSDFVAAAANAASGIGSKLVLADYPGTTIQATVDTLSTKSHSSSAIAYVQGGRVFYFYGSSEANTATREFGLEMYGYETPAPHRVYTKVIETANVFAGTIRTPAKGLSATKTTIAYIVVNPDTTRDIHILAAEAGEI